MRILLPSALACVLFVGCATTEWRTYENSTGSITFKMPSVPEETKQTVNTDLGPLDVIMQSSEANEIYFATSVITYTSEALQGKDAKAILDGARDGAVSSIQGKLLSELLIQKDGVAGRELRIESSDKALTVVARIYFDNNTLYQAIAATKKEKAFSGEILKFLDSIVIKKKVLASTST